MSLVLSGAFVRPMQGAAAAPGMSRAAVSAGDVTSVVLHATPEFEGGKSFVVPCTLDPATGKYEAQILDMKVGTYLFRADASAVDGTLLFTAERSFIVQRKVVSLLALVLQQVPAPGTAHVAAPRIVALTVSNASPAFGDTLTLSLTAVNPDPAGSLTYSWEAACEADPAATIELSAPTSATTQLTTTCGTALLVTGRAQASPTLQSALTTRIRYGTQGVTASIGLNSFPDITDLGSASGQAIPSLPALTGGAIPLLAAASDADGDPLAYAWSSSCDGTFELGDTLSPIFHTPSAVPAPDGGCTLTLEVRDGRGGSVTGTVQVWIVNPIVINELLYDGVGIDTDVGNLLFVELWGTPGQSLDGFSLVGVNGAGGADYNVLDLTGHAIGADGYFVIAHPQGDATLTALADLLTATVDYQNGSDSLQLRLAGGIVDAVGYGLFGETSVFGGEGHPTVDVLPGASLTRDPAHTDTGDNLADFTETAVPTPRAP